MKIPHWRKPTLIAATLAAFSLGPAHAQQEQCTDRDTAVANLAKNYNEVPVWMGLASSGGVVEVLVSEDGATWSIIVTKPNGQACLAASGEYAQDVERVLDGTGS